MVVILHQHSNIKNNWSSFPWGASSLLQSLMRLWQSLSMITGWGVSISARKQAARTANASIKKGQETWVLKAKPSMDEPWWFLKMPQTYGCHGWSILKAASQLNLKQLGGGGSHLLGICEGGLDPANKGSFEAETCSTKNIFFLKSQLEHSSAPPKKKIVSSHRLMDQHRTINQLKPFPSLFCPKATTRSLNHSTTDTIVGGGIGKYQLSPKWIWSTYTWIKHVQWTLLTYGIWSTKERQHNHDDKGSRP